MNNREALIQGLQNGGDYETDACTVGYIRCPYCSSFDCSNEKLGNKYGTDEFREGCTLCKIEWLDKEFEG